MDRDTDDIDNFDIQEANEVEAPIDYYDLSILETLDPTYRDKPGVNLFSKTVKGQRAEMKDAIGFWDTIKELFRVMDRTIQIDGFNYSPELMWNIHHRDIVFSHLRGLRHDFIKNFDIFTPEEQAVLQAFITRSNEYQKEWREEGDHSMRCPLFMDMDRVLLDVGGL